MQPDDDLRAYADARGLSHRGNSTQVGWMAAMGMSEELQFNVLRGVLPGGEHGIVFHDVKVLGAGFGLKYGEQIAGPKRSRLDDWGVPTWRDLNPLRGMVGDEPLYKVAHTTAAIRVPEANGLILGINAARPPEGGAMTTGQWTEVAGAPRGWQIGVRECAIREVVDDVVTGPLTTLLTGPGLPLGFSVTYRFGTLMVTRQHFVTGASDLDFLCEQASWLAGELRAVCARHARPRTFDAELPEPDWLAGVRAKPAGDTFLGGDAQNLGSVVRLADETGLALEDAFEFMRSFPHLPYPGEAFGVLRGALPGTDVRGRVVVAIERPAWDVKHIQKALEQQIGGPFGCDAVLLAVDAPDTPGTEGEQWIQGGRVAVQGRRARRLAPARARQRAAPRGRALCAETVEAVRGRGLVC